MRAVTVKQLVMAVIASWHPDAVITVVPPTTYAEAEAAVLVVLHELGDVRLIMAAPDLLASVRQARDFAQDAWMNHGMGSEMMDLLNQAIIRAEQGEGVAQWP
jgi:hypothetical protein